MRTGNKGRRRLLSIGVGAVAITAIEGLACGNPVEPRGPGSIAPAPDASPTASTTPSASPSASADPPKP